MPIYEFMCSACGHRFEKLVSIGGEKNVTCADCASSDIQKLVSAFGIGGGSSRIKQNKDSCKTCSTHNCSTCR